MGSATGHQSTHWLLFSGHRIDVPGRATPRFPANSEAIASQMIYDAISAQLEGHPDDLFCGVSSGANGGDILFLEACEALNVSTEIYLALDEKEFARVSVADAGGDWLERFEKLLQTRPTCILANDSTSQLNVWQQTNLWMLNSILSHHGVNMTVIVLWDGNVADGPGGTLNMVKQARAAGAKVVHLNAATLTQ
jgi:hypothetical protein